MLGIQLMLLAAAFIALSNYLMRKSIDSGGTTKGFLMVQLCVVFLVAILLNPVRMGEYEWSPSMSLFGAVGGIVLALMMASLGRALETGPAGLTFAALNASSVMPSIITSIVFGASFGHGYTIWNGLGSLLVVIGLYWAGWSSPRTEKKMTWVSFVLAAFILHVIFLVFLSWRALFIRYGSEKGLLLSFDIENARNAWFMPMVFLAAFILQALIFWVDERRTLKKGELLYGILGGIANGIGTFLMIRSTEVAKGWEQAMIYPLLSVSIIILCNLWGQWFYKEKVHWAAIGVCIIGLAVGTIVWSSI